MYRLFSVTLTNILACIKYSWSAGLSLAVLISASINRGYFMIRPVTNMMHSGTPFFFNNGFSEHFKMNCWYLRSLFIRSLWTPTASLWLLQNAPYASLHFSALLPEFRRYMIKPSITYLSIVMPNYNVKWNSPENCLYKISEMEETTGCSFWRILSSSKNGKWISIILSIQGNILSTTSLDRFKYLYIPSTNI